MAPTYGAVANGKNMVFGGAVGAAFIGGAAATTTADALAAAGFSDRIIAPFLRPFLAGIQLDPALSMSSRAFSFVMRMFAQGDTVLPARGMSAIPRSSRPACLTASSRPAGGSRPSTAAASQRRHTGGRRAASMFLASSALPSHVQGGGDQGEATVISEHVRQALTAIAEGAVANALESGTLKFKAQGRSAPDTLQDLSEAAA